MPTELQKVAMRTVYRADYNLAVLQARRGHDGYKAWLERRPVGQPLLPGTPGHGSDFYPIAPLVDTVRTLDDGNAKRHAMGSLAESLVLARSLGHGAFGAGGIQTLSGLFGQDTLDELILAPPEQAYIIGAFASTGNACQVKVLEETFTFDNFDVSTAGLKFECTRPVQDLPPNFDPRMWDVRAPEIFAAADRINQPPPDPMVTPAGIESLLEELDNEGEGWGGLLFEDAVASNGGDELVEFRNVLQIGFTPSIDGSEPTDNIRLKYQLYEGLSIQLFNGATFPGGLDRDSGVLEVDSIAGGSRHFVTKSLRVARPVSRRRLLNFSVAIALRFWLKSISVLGVCEDLNT